MAGKINSLFVIGLLDILGATVDASALRQPLLADHYPNIAEPINLGPPYNWPGIATSVFLNQATSASLMAEAQGLLLAALACLSLALLSEESAVIFALLFLLPQFTQSKKLRSPLLQFFGFAGDGAWSVYALNAASFRLINGSCSFNAPFSKFVTLCYVRK